jgi:hypothetical protein
MAYSTELTWTLGKNNKGDNAKRPDYRGEITINGVVYSLSGWIKTNQAKGTKFISGKAQVKDQPKPQPAPDHAQGAQSTQSADDLAEDVPF